jgi:hypothetical protein
MPGIRISESPASPSRHCRRPPRFRPTLRPRLLVAVSRSSSSVPSAASLTSVVLVLLVLRSLAKRPADKV